MTLAAGTLACGLCAVAAPVGLQGSPPDALAQVRLPPSTQAQDIVLEAQGRADEVQRQYQKALDAYQAALPLRVSRLGAEAEETIALLESIGAVWYHLGQPQQALAAFSQALAGAQKRAGVTSLRATGLLAAVGTLQLELNQLDAAHTSLTRALAQQEALVKPGNLDTGWMLFTLGRLRTRTGEPERARDDLLRALGLYQAALGPDDPELALVQETLGLVEVRLRLVPEALVHLSAALASNRRTYGPTHAVTARLYDALAQLYTSGPPGTTDNLKALSYSSLYVQAFFANQQSAFQSLDNEGKLRYNAQAHRQFEKYFETVFIERAVDETASRPLVQAAFDSWLTFKGSAYALENGLSALLSRTDAKIRAEVETYLTLRRELAALSTGQPLTVAEAVTNTTRAGTIRQQLSALEAQLSGQLGRFQDVVLPGRLQGPDLKAVLRPGEVYLDYVWTDTNVFVFAYRWDGRFDVQWLPLAGRLGEQFETLRRGAEAGLSLEALRPQASFLYDMLVRPVLPTLNSATAVVISPDGPLHFLPFELLSDGQQLLMEQVVVRYIPSARDLVRLRHQARTQTPGPSVVFGNPAFGASPTRTASRSAAGAVATPAPSTGVPAGPPALTTLSRLLRGTVFGALPGTETEARLITRLLGSSTRMFLGTEASGANLAAVRSPRVLHLGTHGFFLRDDRQRALLPNPLLRAGLALAGAQSSLSGGGADGLVPGLQLAGLSLEGTELVVLSACDTGLGDAVAGEGVAGLNQAFLTAGARQIMLSQWKVPDAETATLMADFYARYTGGTEAAEALRQAKLVMMRRGLPPRDWAAFLLSGV
ncbi:CHAT domain-containing protein [Deinococcus navajonensis]|uniref:CHAT domain-containing protein n=1 Tax=Deinococcus navajonensis TaxID=309884 RepID=A0ABV8XLX3_9DEIO